MVELIAFAARMEDPIILFVDNQELPNAPVPSVEIYDSRRED